VLPQLQRNADLNAAVGATATACTPSHDTCPGRVCALPLAWGDAASAADLLASLPAVVGDELPSLVIGADIIYHEHLIDILVESLVAISDGLVAMAACKGSRKEDAAGVVVAPPIVIR
jgi:hypothetical protein